MRNVNKTIETVNLTTGRPMLIRQGVLESMVLGQLQKFSSSPSVKGGLTLFQLGRAVNIGVDRGPTGGGSPIGRPIEVTLKRLKAQGLVEFNRASRVWETTGKGQAAIVVPAHRVVESQEEPREPREPREDIPNAG